MATNLPPLNDTEQLSPLVTRILGGNPGKFTLQGTNTYLIGHGPSRILIDTAQGLPAWRSALSTLLHSPSPAPPLTITTVLLTHHHLDHTLGIPDLLSLCPEAKIYKYPSPSLPPNAPSAITSPPEQKEAHVLPIADGQIFTTSGATLRAIHAPGHTADHVCFLLEEEGALFTGDNVLGHGTAVFEDLGLYMRSLEAMRRVQEWVGRAYPGHGEVVEDGVGRVEMYIKHREWREGEVLQVVGRWKGGDGRTGEGNGSGGGVREGGKGGEGMTAAEVVKVVYKDVPVSLHEAAERGVLQVLEKLEGEGRVRGDGGRWMVLDWGREKESL